jgi:outer membrane protein TolC
MRAAVDAAEANIESAGALADPMLSYAVAPNTFGYPGQGLNQNIQISQTFPWPGTLDLRSDAATAAAKSVGYQLVDVRLQLAAQARAIFADWYYVHQALQIHAKNQTLLARLKKVAETEYRTGQAPQQDMLQAEVALTRLKNQALRIGGGKPGCGAAPGKLSGMNMSTKTPAQNKKMSGKTPTRKTMPPAKSSDAQGGEKP